MSNTEYETPLSNTTVEWSRQYSYLPSTRPVRPAQAIHYTSTHARSIDESGGAVDSASRRTVATEPTGIFRSSPALTRRTSEVVVNNGSGSTKGYKSFENVPPSTDVHQRYSSDIQDVWHHNDGASQIQSALPAENNTITAATMARQHHHLPNLIDRSRDCPNGVPNSSILSLADHPFSSTSRQDSLDVQSADHDSKDRSCLKDSNDVVIDSKETSKASLSVPLVRTAASRKTPRKKMKRFR